MNRGEWITADAGLRAHHDNVQFLQEFCAGWADLGACNIKGSSGMMIHAIGYDRNPITVIQATISHTTRTSVTSMSKYSAKPRQTPAIFRPSRGRISFRRANEFPTRVPQ